MAFCNNCYQFFFFFLLFFLSALRLFPFNDDVLWMEPFHVSQCTFKNLYHNKQKENEDNMNRKKKKKNQRYRLKKV